MQNKAILLLSEYMPDVLQYKSQFESLNALLNKTTLTGKISSLDIAENLFAYMEETQQKFAELQEELINTLIEQKHLTILDGAKLNAQSSIDVLNRSLFERTSDIVLLSKSDVIYRYLTNHTSTISREALENRLSEYALKYSTYEDIIVFDRDSNIVARLGGGSTKSSKESLIQQTLNMQEEFLESFAVVDFIDKKTPSLIYSAPVQKPGTNERVGVIATVFKFEDELERIFKRFHDNAHGSLIMLLDAKNRVIGSLNPNDFPIGSALPIQKIGNHHFVITSKRAYMLACAKAQGYFGYTGLGWSAALLIPLRSAFDSKHFNFAKIPHELLEESSLMTSELKHVISEAENINEDLGDVVINGEIIASKSHSYALNPILNNIRLLSEEINQVCVDSIRGLQKTILASALHGVAFYAKVAIDLIDRNLYERASDCRWWAMTLYFVNNMRKCQEPEVRDTMTATLCKINTLYPMYHNLVLFDASGKIVAISNKDESRRLGGFIAEDDFARVCGIRDTQKYHVSQFVPSHLYHDKPTYIFYAPILSNDDERSFIGGMALVFDAEVQFGNMLRDSLPKKSDESDDGELFGLLVERGGKIIASTSSELKPGEILELDSRLMEIKDGREIDEIISFRGKQYMLGVQTSLGYREFKNSDGYINHTACFMFIEV
ncbi:MAG: cache domain-containing protein [Wolinella sp.]